MKIDFHTHGKLAKKLPFSKEYTDWLFCEAVDAGLDAICLTEHFNTLGFEEVYEYIKDTYSYKGDSFITQYGLKIFPGMEVDIAEGGHTLVIGEIDTILKVNRLLEPYKEKNQFMPAKEWMDMAKNYNLLLGAAHPFRDGGHIHELPLETQKAFDFIDRNGKDTAKDDRNNMKQLVQMKDTIMKPIIAGSDTHQSFQYGCIYNQFEKDCYLIDELKEEIKKENYKIVVSDHVKFQVRTAGILKKSLKTIHACGGDYVSVLLAEVE